MNQARPLNDSRGASKTGRGHPNASHLLPSGACGSRPGQNNEESGRDNQKTGKPVCRLNNSTLAKLGAKRRGGGQKGDRVKGPRIDTMDHRDKVDRRRRRRITEGRGGEKDKQDR